MTDSGISILWSDLQFEKAPLPMEVTLFGIDTDVALSSAKSQAPISVIPLLMTISVILVLRPYHGVLVLME